MKKYSPQLKKRLRELALLAIEKELGLQLQELAEHVESWKSGKLSNRELRHVLHAYVDGPSRELFRRHREVPDDIFVADAVARNVLKEEEVPQELLPYIRNGVQFYSKVLENHSDSE